MATGTDATAELIRSLDDPSKWELVRDVVVFRAHERDIPAVTLPDGKVLPARKVVVTDADLPLIAERLNAEIDATGYLRPLTVGHRNFHPDFPEADQPKLVGFARNYRAARVDRDGESFLAVLEDEYVMKDRRAALRDYPYRSLDWDITNKTSVGTALLVRPPFLKLGAVCVYQGEVNVADDDNDEPTGDEVKQYERFCRYMAKRFPRLAQYMDGVGPGNGNLPEPVKNAADATAFAQYQADLAAVKDQLAAERKARVTAECRAMLDPLRAARKFDYNRELAALVGMAESDRVAHVKYMADNYLPLPTGPMIDVYRGSTDIDQVDDKNDPTREQPRRAEIVARMRANPGTSYEAAEAEVLSGRK